LRRRRELGEEEVEKRRKLRDKEVEKEERTLRGGG
jgi:hypothetical protein